ncbi:hypothetical protein CLV98_12316 [Dyadobacter jejuensis]|uniref:Uncharacterized protein n=1 Tax=Dyadobacter jejuensis TaxID=1082580 RepID=A0A316A7G0_9BACT|nr:hypothetical protein [Dyadobacter jejuensis]PWJ53402.1 hypothetical protein CLV98_12316 [Dyadobacter jejuensis]
MSETNNLDKSLVNKLGNSINNKKNNLPKLLVEDKYKSIKDKTVVDIINNLNKTIIKNKEISSEISINYKPEPNKNVQVIEKKEVKPIVVEPLNSRERKEVKSDFEQGKLENNKHANHIFKKFEKQMNSIPDKINGNNLTNQDKIKLLVGDYNDHQNTKFTIQKDKTVQMQGPNQKITQLNNFNSEFSASQISKKQEVIKQNKTGLSI